MVSRQISKIEGGKVKHTQLSSMALSLSQEDISCLQTELPKFLKFWVLNFPPNYIQVYASCKFLSGKQVGMTHFSLFNNTPYSFQSYLRDTQSYQVGLLLKGICLYLQEMLLFYKILGIVFVCLTLFYNKMKK